MFNIILYIFLFVEIIKWAFEPIHFLGPLQVCICNFKRTLWNKKNIKHVKKKLGDRFIKA